MNMKEPVVPNDQQARQSRHEAILSILRSRRVRRQEQLVEQLGRQGFEVTQSSISRDLRELGIAKVGGRYVVPTAQQQEEAEAIGLVARFLRGARPAGPYLTVVQTAVGAAQAFAAALDRSGWPEVLGSVAGDDTIFVATAGAREQSRLLHRLGELMARPGPGDP